MFFIIEAEAHKVIFSLQSKISIWKTHYDILAILYAKIHY